MQNILKQFGAKGSVSFEKRFNLSIIVLTFIYSITLGVILFISSTFSYSIFSSRLGARFERIPPGQQIQLPIEIDIRRGPTVDEVRKELFDAFVRVNGILFLLAVVLSYFLARLTLRPLKDAYEDQRRFIADASHELKTPLAVMHIELENEIAELKTKNLPVKKLESNLDEVKRMSKIVQDLLYLSKLEHDKTFSEIKVLDIQDMLETSVHRLQALAQSKNVELIFKKIDKVIEVKAHDQISHVFANIIQNAIVYNKLNGKVNVDIYDKKKTVEITVKDTGIGMSSVDLKYIFDRFYRADKSRSRSFGGSGLGLSITKQIIESVNGSIDIESELDKGTTVKIILPKV